MSNWKSALAGLAVAVAVPASGQDTANADILRAVDGFLAGLNAKDAAAMAAVSTSDGSLVSHRIVDGKARIRARSFAQDIADIAKEKDSFREVYWDPAVLVRGNIAVVWAEYSFDLDAKRSHCGIDVFNLMKIDGAWKVTGIQYTVEPDTCPKGR